MLKEFAITPDAFDSVAIGVSERHERALLDVLYKVTDSGMIANLDADGWRKVVQQKIVDLENPNTKMKLERLLGILIDRHRLPQYSRRKPAPASLEMHWIQLIGEAVRTHEFDAIAVGPFCDIRQIAKRPVMNLEDLQYAEMWESPRAPRIRMREVEIRLVLEPLVRHARQIELVDPYLAADARSTRDFVQLLAGLAGDGRSNSCSVRIAINTTLAKSKATSATEEIERWRIYVDRLRSDLGVTHQFRVAIWQKNLGDDDLHDRYLLTDQTGVMVGRGFDCLADSTQRKTTWTLLDYPSSNGLRVEFNPDVRPGLIMAKSEYF